jgi:hypothetical protein
MAQLTETQLITAVNKKIKQKKDALGGDTEIRRILNESQGDLRLDMDLISAKRTSAPFLVFNGIEEYALPEDIDYDKAISFSPTDNDLGEFLWERVPLKYFYRPQNPAPEVIGTQQWLLNTAYDRSYDQHREVFTIDFDDAQPFLMLRSGLDSLSSAKIVQTADVTTSDGGTWVASGDAANVRKDTQNFKTESSSVEFDSGGASTSVVITNSTFTAADLSSYEDKGELHLWVYLPATAPASITLQWGSHSSNYWQKTVTARKSGLSFKEGWNLLAFDWNNVDSEVGSPVSSSVGYVNLTLTNSVATALKSYRIDGLYARLGKSVTMQYYSKYLVVSSAGVRKENFTASSDSTILESQEVNQLIEKAFQKASLELRENADYERASNEYKMRKQMIEEAYPSEKELEGTTYYFM